MQIRNRKMTGARQIVPLKADAVGLTSPPIGVATDGSQPNRPDMRSSLACPFPTNFLLGLPAVVQEAPDHTTGRLDTTFVINHRRQTR